MPRTAVEDPAVTRITYRDRRIDTESKKPPRKKRTSPDMVSVAALQRESDGGASGGTEFIPAEWVSLVRVLFANEPESTRCLDFAVTDPESGQDFLLYVSRSAECTPHALREAAERRAAELEAEISELDSGIRELHRRLSLVSHAVVSGGENRD